MNGNKALFDSNVIIYLSKGIIRLEDFTSSYEEFNVSIISYIETLGYDFTNETEEALVENFLNTFSILPLTNDVADLVIDYRKRSRIKIPDAIILATASLSESILITNNVNDFKGIDSKVTIEEIKP